MTHVYGFTVVFVFSICFSRKYICQKHTTSFNIALDVSGVPHSKKNNSMRLKGDEVFWQHRVACWTSWPSDRILARTDSATQQGKPTPMGDLGVKRLRLLRAQKGRFFLTPMASMRSWLIHSRLNIYIKLKEKNVTWELPVAKLKLWRSSKGSPKPVHNSQPACTMRLGSYMSHDRTAEHLRRIIDQEVLLRD